MAHYLIAIGSMRRENVVAVSSIVAQGAGGDQNPLDMTIVVPCLNEENHIGPTLDTVVTAMMELPYSYEVMVVDDGSTDGTAKTVESYIAAHPGLPIRLIRHPQNRGLTRSYVDGAFLGRGTYYRLVCGDNAESKDALVTCFSQLGKADMIIPFHQEVEGKSAFRLWLSNLYTTMVNFLSGYKIHYYNGLAVHLRYNVMRWGPYSFGFGFQAELITRLLDEGSSYVEVPITATHRDKSRGNSALNFKNLMSVCHTLSEVFVRRVRKRALRK
jgi:glycosyltransferase involved in cell wall biosynthesis